jgi:hypothetical protein
MLGQRDFLDDPCPRPVCTAYQIMQRPLRQPMRVDHVRIFHIVAQQRIILLFGHERREGFFVTVQRHILCGSQCPGPAYGCLGSRVQSTHLADLMTFLSVMSLIDADLVDPDPLRQSICCPGDCAEEVV